jgi:hypothetical protein
MKIATFIENFKKAKLENTKVNPNAIGNYIKKELEVKDYLPFAEKRELCTRVLEVCNNMDTESGLVKVDSVTRYIVFTISILSTYTNLEFYSDEDDIDSLDGYDMLCQSGLLNPILDVIGDEYVTCNNMLNMMMSDIMTNNNTVESVVGNVLGKFGTSADVLIGALASKVESMELDLSQIDINKISGLIEKFTKK